MQKIIQFFISRAKERSSWLGLISIATALGLLLTPEQTDAVVAAGMSLAGLIGTLMADKK